MTRKFGLTLLTSVFVLSSGVSALAVKQFYEAWVEVYVDEEDESEENKEFVEVVTGKKTRCLVCHQGKKKKNHNVYGKHLVELLSKEDKDDTDKIAEALKEVGAMSSDPEVDADDEDAITHDELIAKHELPGGNLEDLQDEPEESGDE